MCAHFRMLVEPAVQHLTVLRYSPPAQATRRLPVKRFLVFLLPLEPPWSRTGIQLETRICRDHSAGIQRILRVDFRELATVPVYGLDCFRNAYIESPHRP